MNRLGIFSIGLLVGALLGFSAGLNIGMDRDLFTNPFEPSVVSR